MRWILILAIKIYRLLIPAGKRRNCLFRVSCSEFVFQTAKTQGFYKGLAALYYRMSTCNSKHHIFNDPRDGKKRMVLRNGHILNAHEMAERLLTNQA